MGFELPGGDVVQEPTLTGKPQGESRIGDLERLRWLGVWLPVMGVGLLIGLVALAIHLGWPGSISLHPSASGKIKFQDLGKSTGRCFLACHASNHDPKIYP